MSFLEVEVLANLFQFCDIREVLGSHALVCQDFGQATQLPEFYVERVRREFGVIVQEDDAASVYKLRYLATQKVRQVKYEEDKGSKDAFMNFTNGLAQQSSTSARDKLILNHARSLMSLERNLQIEKQYSALLEQALNDIKEEYKDVGGQLKKFQRIDDRIKALEQKNRKLNESINQNRLFSAEDKFLCCICQESLRSVVLMPCKHLVVCHDCYYGCEIKECPICRTKIEDVVEGVVIS